MRGRTLVAIDAELMAAREKFPMPNKTFFALVEEVGELAQALLNCKATADFDASHATQLAVYREALQVAVMAIRLMEEGDADTPSFKPRVLAAELERVG